MRGRRRAALLMALVMTVVAVVTSGAAQAVPVCEDPLGHTGSCPEWSVQHSSAAPRADAAVAPTPDGRDVVVVVADRALPLAGRVTVRALDAATGAVHWQVQLPAPGPRVFPEVAVSPDGTVVLVAALAFSLDYADSGSVVHALDAGTGAVRWTRGGGDPDLPEQVYGLAVGTRGDVVVAGWPAAQAASLDVVTGVTRWVHRAPAPADEDAYATDVALSPDGDVVALSGGTALGASGDYWVSSLPLGPGVDGTASWTRRYDRSGRFDVAQDVVVLPGGGVVVTGRALEQSGSSTMTTIGYGRDGRTSWEHHYTASFATGQGLALAPSGEVVHVAGFTTPGSAGGSGYGDAVLVGLDPATGSPRYGPVTRGSALMDFVTHVAADDDVVVLGLTLGVPWGLDLDDVLVSSSQPELRAFDARTGQERWRSAPVTAAVPQAEVTDLTVTGGRAVLVARGTAAGATGGVGSVLTAAHPL